MVYVYDAEKMAAVVEKKLEKVTQATFSEETGLSKPTLHRIFELQNVSLGTLGVLCGWLGKSPGQFFKKIG